MSVSVLSLPIPLILLVHLHILEYPHANKPEYDHHIFEPRVRGLRERTKLLEDVCYFLVGRIASGSAKTILPTYPCLAPSDTVAFRTSLAKYLETLRHDALYPSSNAINGKVKVKNETTAVAWWWKDVVVRKSLLEECAGEKFERLLLSVLTHALLKGTLSSNTIVPENSHTLLRSQPTIYTALLAKCKAARHDWSRSASLLLRRQEDIRALREHLKSPAPSKYASLPTTRLLALADSKHQDLLRRIWPGGQRALEFLTKLSGIETPTSSQPLDNTLTGSPAPQQQHPTVPPPPPPHPLPVAAAHHPANLKNLRKPVFPSNKPKPKPKSAPPPTTAEAGAGTGPWTRDYKKIGLANAAKIGLADDAKIGLADYAHAELRTREALADALARMRKVGEGLVLRKRKLDEKLMEEARKGVNLLDLWQQQPQDSAAVDFDTKPTPELLSMLCLDIPETQTLESRIDHVREQMLSSYPPIPDLSVPRAPVAIPVPVPSPNPDPCATKPGGSSKIPHRAAQAVRGTSSSSAVRAPPPRSSQTRVPSLLPSPPRPLLTPTVGPARPYHHHHHQDQGKKKNDTRMPRKSIRLSLALVSRRPSLFMSEEEEDGKGFEDDVERIILNTSTSSDAPATPKGKTPKPNRIFTGSSSSSTAFRSGGSTLRRGKKKKPKQSYPMVFPEPGVQLPSLLGMGAEASFDGLYRDADQSTGSEEEDGWGEVGMSWGKGTGTGTGREGRGERPERGVEGEDGEEYAEEAPSMTLRDILLSADTTQFDLLDDEDGQEGMLLAGIGEEEDASFEWA